MSKDDLIRLRHMLDAAREAMAFTRGRARDDLETDRQVLPGGIARYWEDHRRPVDDDSGDVSERAYVEESSKDDPVDLQLKALTDRVQALAKSVEAMKWKIVNR